MDHHDLWKKALPVVCRLLHCTPEEVQDVRVLAGGRTNVSFALSVHGRKYVYRHPGEQTDAFISRGAERFACEKACELGLDGSYLCMDEQYGWKLSRFVEEVRTFDFASLQDIEEGAQLLRRLHGARITAPYRFDYRKQLHALCGCMDDRALKQLEPLASFEATFEKLLQCICADGWPQCLCHGDPKAANFMISTEGYALIDWEYAGVRDIGFDIAHYAAEAGRARCAGRWTLDREDASLYFRAPVSEEQYRHVLACFAVDEYFWSVWGVQKNAQDVVERCFSNARHFGKLACGLYGC